MTLDELQKVAELAEARAKDRALKPEEAAVAALHERIARAAEDEAAADAVRRGNDGKAREAAAAAKLGSRALVLAIDLVAFFPLGKAPPPEDMPGRGVIIVRDPPADATDAFNREVEAKKRGLASIFADLLCACLVDPDPDTPAGTTVRVFVERYPNVAIGAGDKANKLGGSKAEADKRGRA